MDMMVFLFFVVLIGVFLIPTPSSEDKYKAFKEREANREKKLQELDLVSREKELAKEDRTETGIIIFWCFIAFIVFGASLSQCTDNRSAREEYEDQERWERTRR